MKKKISLEFGKWELEQILILLASHGYDLRKEKEWCEWTGNKTKLKKKLSAIQKNNYITEKFKKALEVYNGNEH